MVACGTPFPVDAENRYLDAGGLAQSSGSEEYGGERGMRLPAQAAVAGLAHPDNAFGRRKVAPGRWFAGVARSRLSQPLRRVVAGKRLRRPNARAQAVITDGMRCITPTTRSSGAKSCGAAAPS